LRPAPLNSPPKTLIKGKLKYFIDNFSGEKRYLTEGVLLKVKDFDDLDVVIEVKDTPKQKLLKETRELTVNDLNKILAKHFGFKHCSIEECLVANSSNAYKPQRIYIGSGVLTLRIELLKEEER
jgi:hypothetical protein